MVVSAALLLREKGLTGTSFGDVIEHSGAPRGSIYHHFPEGKEQLVEDALRYAGDYVVADIERAAASGGPAAAVRAFVDGWRRVLETSEYRAGCPVVAVTVEAHAGDSRLAAATTEVFSAWRARLEEPLREGGLSRARARTLATTTVAAIEGAVVLCRAERDIAPLEDVGRELEKLLNEALRGNDA